MIKFQVLGKIQPKQRPRVTRYGTYTPKPTLDYEAIVRYSYLAVSKHCFVDKPIQLTVKAYFHLPQRTTNQEYDYCMKNIDLDNVIKIVCDGLNGIAYTDDKQIVSLIATKQWAKEEYLEIEIKEL